MLSSGMTIKVSPAQGQIFDASEIMRNACLGHELLWDRRISITNGHIHFKPKERVRMSHRIYVTYSPSIKKKPLRFGNVTVEARENTEASVYVIAPSELEIEKLSIKVAESLLDHGWNVWFDGFRGQRGSWLFSEYIGLVESVEYEQD